MEARKNSVSGADDEPVICKTLKMLSEKKWYEVSYVMTEKRATRKIKKRKINLALFNIKLPDMERTKLIHIFKKMYPDIKIVMMTGESTKDNATSVLNNGVSYYFAKPFNTEVVLIKENEPIEQQGETSFQGGVQEAAKFINVRDIAKSNNLFPEELPLKIRKAIEYIEKNYTNPDLCLKEVAGSVNMHSNSFSYVWNKSVGKNITGFINDIRIAKAKELLIETTDYAFQIAYKVGFDFCNFNRVFKTKTGISPSKYRNLRIPEFPI
ncbi:MAG: response regulator transcription factor [bacterium]|nr:response regulator transcription factor [bacterium]